MHTLLNRKTAGILAISLAFGVTACGGMANNPTLYSTKQPVIERTNLTFDVSTSYDGLPIAEQARLDDWFEAMDLRYGDRLSLDDPGASAATRDAVGKLAAKHGILLAKGAPDTTGYVAPGQARVVITRSTASVPGCPDWSTASDINYGNGTYSNYGCATNANLAAMVADPEDLLAGKQGTGETVVTTSTKAIQTYRDKKPTGAQNLKNVSSTEGGS